MKYGHGIFILTGCALHLVQAATVEARHTHSTFYPGLDNQPVLQLKVMGQPGEKISELSFSPGESSAKSKIRKARLSSSGARNCFTLHTQNPVAEKATCSVKERFTFKTSIELGDKPLYLWLSYDLAPSIQRNSKVDAQCLEITMEDGTTIRPDLVLAKGLQSRIPGRVYPFPYRIVPYYRPRWVMGWGKATQAVHLTTEHFNLFTDLIHFAYSCDAKGNITYQWAGGGNSENTVNTALAEIKRLHQEAQSKARLIAGFGHMDKPLTQAIRKPHTRRTLARNMAQWAITRGYQGIDLDWEYPDSNAEWNHFGLFLADLREELAGSGISISLAASVNYRLPTLLVTYQLDFILTMSYGSQTAQHASMERYQREAGICLNKLHMPKPKVVLGLPFYSNEQGKLTDQYGYSQIYAWHPNLRPEVNTFRSRRKDGSDGPMHSFNGRKMIGDKCKWAKDNHFGGVMIWAYETDLPLKHPASLGRAMYRVLRQPRK
jgi:hypothetical protein